jgi:hypothetical protein
MAWNRRSMALDLPTMYDALMRCNRTRFFSLTIPPSVTQAHLAQLYFCSIAVTISSTVVASLRVSFQRKWDKPASAGSNGLPAFEW